MNLIPKLARFVVPAAFLPKAWASPYDAANWSPSRGRVPGSAPRDAKPNLIFDQIAVENSLGWDVLLNGTYKPDIPAISFNFVIRGVGPVCRIDVNGTIHGPAGRTHKLAE